MTNRAQYQVEWRAKRHRESAWIKCACGCGTKMREYNEQGYKRKYVHGHYSSSKRKIEPAQVSCACGCGKTFINIHPKSGLVRQYLPGHHLIRYRDSEESKGQRYRRVNKSKLRIKLRNWHRSKKVELIKISGGTCSKCGIKFNGDNAAIFDFHHLNPKVKEQSITYMLTRFSLKRILPELKKCVMLCSNCHRLEHNQGD